MNLFISFFGCGKVNIRSNRCDFYIQDFTKIDTIIIPHFELFPLYNIKSLDFQDFTKCVELFKQKPKNVEAIRNIVSNMNSKRTHE